MAVRDVIPAMYRQVDRVVGEVLAQLDPKDQLLLCADHEYSIALKDGRKRLVMPPSGVCRLRVGLCVDGRITMDQRKVTSASSDVDASVIGSCCVAVPLLLRNTDDSPELVLRLTSISCRSGRQTSCYSARRHNLSNVASRCREVARAAVNGEV